MPTYVFEAMDGSGDVVERHLPMSQAPDLGATLDVEGRVYRRVMSPGIQIGGEMGWRKRKKWPVHSETLPRWQRPEKEPDSLRTGFDEKGRPVIRSQRHENELAARLGRQRLDRDGD